MDFTFYRDEIRLNQKFYDWFGKQVVAGIVKLVARDFQIEKDFELVDHSLVIIADKFVASRCKICCSGSNGPSIMVVCRELVGINAISKAVNGSNGACGKNGEPGQPGRKGKPGDPDGTDGKPGGVGGNGRNGGNGGNGGQIKVYYITASGNISLSAEAGKAGAGGKGGKAGKGGKGGRGYPPNGKDGKDGRDGIPGWDGKGGKSGKLGSTEHIKITEDEYWRKVGEPDWANYRVRVGEYLLRSFIPNIDDSNFLGRAMDEFNAALKLDPKNAQAIYFKDQILNNCNVLALSRDIDIIPSFEYWEDVVKNYDEPILSMFNAIIDIVNKGYDIEWAKSRLEVEISSAKNLTEILKIEKQAAILEIDISDKEIEFAEKRLSEIRERIKVCENDTFSFGDVILTFVKVAALIGSIAAGGAGLVAAAPALVVFLDQISESGLLNALKSEEGKKNIKELSGGLKDLYEGSKAIIDLIRVINEISTTESRRPDCQILLRQEVEILHELLLAKLHKQQANVLLLAKNARIANQEAYKKAIEKQKNELTGNISQIREIVNMIRKSLKYYTDIYLGYVFYEARSLEIYTSTDLPANLGVRYDYVCLHPDLEENFMVGFGENNDNVMLNFIDEQLKIWDLFIKNLEYRRWYDNYLQVGERLKDQYRITFTKDKNADIIDRFREVNELQFTVDIGDLPSSRYEAKVESIELFLYGVKSNSAITPAISCFCEHSGLWTTKKLNGDIINMTLRPRQCIVVVEEIEPGKYRGKTFGTKPNDLSFWGRGVAATWHLYIEQEEINNYNIDLSALFGIEIWIGYEFILKQPKALCEAILNIIMS